ncbi:MAG: autotransporter-associated beta strand repeat-containing protein [Verrucomicrobiota bacterium]
MKTRKTSKVCRFKFSSLTMAAVVALASSTTWAATYDWKGTTSSAWSTAGNWNANAVPTFNATEGSRLNVASLNVAASRELVYDASLGTTVYGANGTRGMVIGSSAGAAVIGTNRITGGTFSTAGETGGGTPDIIGNGVGGTGYLIIDGGNYISGTDGLQMGINITASGTLTVNSGTATITTLALFNYASTVNLNGGTLAVNSITYPTSGGGSSPNVRWSFNGGTLKARANTTTFLPLPTTPVLSADVRNGGAIFDTAAFNVQVDQPLFHSTIGGDAAIDGGLTKNSSGILTMTGVNTYTGPTIVNGGTLSEPMPVSSSALKIASGAALTVSTTPALWSVATANMTNANLTFNYGSFPDFNFSQPNLNVTSLSLVGTTTVNLSGQNLTVGNITLLTYGSKTGGGSFVLGTLPSGAVGNITDDGATVVLHVTTGSAQSLVWSAGDGGFWQTNGALLNWNNGTASYTEYSPSSSDLVTFDDTASGTVNISGNVKPSSLTVNVSSSSYTFANSGSIIGSVGITKLGTSTLQINNSNAFTGPVTISGGSGTSGGTILVNNAKALGATIGTVTVAGPANTLEIGTSGGAGIAVSNKTVTISGAGVGGALGALRGAATASGSNVWAGPVIIGADATRIGTEDGGNLTITGAIKDNGSNYVVLLRPGSSGTLTISGTGNSYGATRTFGDSTSVIKLGANNVLSTNALQLGAGSVDLNGFSQTFGGVSDQSGSGTILNNGAGASTLTINTGTNNYSTSGNLQNGTGTLNLIKSGTGSQTLSGATLSYTGTTTISNGTLNLTPSGTMASSITVQSGATLSGEATTTGSLTLNANSILLADPSTPGSFLAATVNASASPIKISLSSAPAAGADVLILAATGGITGSAGNFQPLGLRGGTFYLTNANTELHYVAAASSPTIVWKGNSPVHPSFWDIFTTTNWNNAGSPDKFFTGDNVLFDDTASSFTVAIQGSSVSPTSVVFSNSASAYTVSGGTLTGTASLVKKSSGLVTLSAANTYTGGTIITNAGTLVANSTSSLGSGPVTSATGATLKLVTSNSGYTSLANNLLGDGTVQLFMTSAGPGNTYLPAISDFGGTIQVANSGNTGDKYNASGITATNATVQVLSASTLYVSQTSTFKQVSVTGIGNNEGRGALRIGSADLLADVTLLGDATFGLESMFNGINGNISGTATAGNTNTLTVGTLSATAGGVFNGVISDGLGGGKLALTQTKGALMLTANSTYSGNTTIIGSTMLLSGSGSISNTAVINLANSSANLDVSAVSFTLSGAQALQGIGSVSGDVVAHGTIVPGSPMGTLTFNSSLDIAGNLRFGVNKSLLAPNAFISVAGTLTNSGSGTLTITNLGAVSLTNNDTFTLFSQPVANGNALTITGPAGVTFTNNLALDGSITVLKVTLTPPTLNVINLGGGSLQFSWTGGGTLQAQTNSLSTGLGTNWVNVPGNSPVTVPLDVTRGSVFFRVKQ